TDPPAPWAPHGEARDACPSRPRAAALRIRVERTKVGHRDMCFMTMPQGRSRQHARKILRPTCSVSRGRRWRQDLESTSGVEWGVGFARGLAARAIAIVGMKGKPPYFPFRNVSDPSPSHE